MKQKKSLREWFSIMVAKNPSRVILMVIMLFNILFMLFSALIISRLVPVSASGNGFAASVFYTISMILDAGCISYVIEDVGQSGVILIIICLVIVMLGMIGFTGGIIGYLTNVISGFIENANAGDTVLNISGHTVILNWNNRASEIINELLYRNYQEKVVVLVPSGREEIEKEIDNRLSDTIKREENLLLKKCRNKTRFGRWMYLRMNRHYTKPVVIVREGDTFAEKELMDVSLDKARSVIILNRDNSHEICKFENERNLAVYNRGNSYTIKTLVLVAQITSSEESADNQKIIVEIEDDWTEELVGKIIKYKENLGKCNIVPMKVNRVLGQLLAQFSIMPELNLVYSELFSNRGAEFYAMKAENKVDYGVYGYMETHSKAIPLTAMDTKAGRHFFFMANVESEVEDAHEKSDDSFDVRLNRDYWLPRRNILILGHNSKTSSLMDAFKSFRNEWNPAKDGREILNICVIDDAKNLERMDNYREFSPYISNVIARDIYDKDRIYADINSFIDDQDGDTCILILSDDNVVQEDLDTNALTYLIYVQDIMSERKKRLGDKPDERIDVIVEILNPKNYDVVHSYSVNNVVISNRFISKIIMQIGEKDALFEFYNDILTYDEEGERISKELYIKRAGDFFEEVPAPSTADELVRAVYRDAVRMGEDNTAVVLGYVTANEKMKIFKGDLRKIQVHLEADDKLIVFSNH